MAEKQQASHKNEIDFCALLLEDKASKAVALT